MIFPRVGTSQEDNAENLLGKEGIKRKIYYHDCRDEVRTVKDKLTTPQSHLGQTWYWGVNYLIVQGARS